MKQDVLRKRRESFLFDVVSESFGYLDDHRLSSLEIVKVECSKGRSDIVIHVNGCSISDKERCETMVLLNKAKHLLRNYIVSISGWRSSPNVSFKFDDTLESSKRLNEIFLELSKRKQVES